MDMQELSNQRTPRYTSYPTAVQFSDAVGSGQAAAWLGDLPAEAPLSLYLHVPFCREVCWYCACNMKLAAREAPVRDYARVLEQEITQLADRLGGRRAVRHLHWGGGTPTSMPDDCMARIMAMLWQRFDFAPDAEIAVAGFFQDHRPLRGGAARVDWRLCGLLSELLMSGELEGRRDEAVLMPSARHLRAPRSGKF